MQSKRKMVAAWIALAVCAMPAALLAQQPPLGVQPGRIEQDVRRLPDPVSREPIVLDRALFPEQVPAGAAQRRFVLRGVEVTGNNSVPDEQLASLWKPHIGQEVSVADAFAIAEAITALYRERGFVLSQAIVPPQDLPVDGALLRIAVVEGFINQIRFTAPAEMAARLEPIVARLRDERPLTLQTMERYLLLLNERAGIVSRANLSRSLSMADASDLEIVVAQVPAAYSVSVSNHGSKALGPVRFEGGAEWRDPLRMFDRHSARIITSGDRRLAFVAYNFDMPLGVEGTKLLAGASASRSRPDTATSLELDTVSDTLTLGANHPFLRSRRSSLDGRVTMSAYNNLISKILQPTQR